MSTGRSSLKVFFWVFKKRSYFIFLKIIFWKFLIFKNFNFQNFWEVTLTELLDLGSKLLTQRIMYYPY